MDDLFEQTLAIAKKIYEDPESPPLTYDIFTAAAVGSYDSVNAMVRQKVQLNIRNKGGWSPLMYAAYMGHDIILNLLLESGADPNYCSPQKLSPLMIAAGCGNESVCYFLLQHNASINAQDSLGLTPLYHATRQGHQNCVRLLLETGADMEIQEHENGSTALIEAAKEGHEIILETLIACGADSKVKTKSGHTARSLALKHNQMMVVSLLDNAQYVQNYANAWDESCESLNEEGDIMSGPEEFSRNYDPALQPTAVVLARRRSSATIQKLPQRKQEEEDVTYDSKILEFLAKLRLEKYAELFSGQEIDFDTLLTLTDSELKQIGIAAFGPRRKILLAIEQYNQGAGTQKATDYHQVQQTLKELKTVLQDSEQTKDYKIKVITDTLEQMNVKK